MLELSEGDEAFSREVQREIERLEQAVVALELKALLNGPHDAFGAIVTINARDGGTDANDWAEMLLRMYTLWAQKNGYSIELLERQDSEQAGISHAAVAIRGPMAYGYLKGETGMHRLVRISPFNAEGKRQTSFAAVDVSPELHDDHRNRDRSGQRCSRGRIRAGRRGRPARQQDRQRRSTDSLADGIVVQCQNERSQHKNRATARRCFSPAWFAGGEKNAKPNDAAKYQHRAKVGFGSQIRNYFLHPDQRVKDAARATWSKLQPRPRRQPARLSRLVSEVAREGRTRGQRGRRGIDGASGRRKPPGRTGQRVWECRANAQTSSIHGGRVCASSSYGPTTAIATSFRSLTLRESSRRPLNRSKEHPTTIGLLSPPLQNLSMETLPDGRRVALPLGMSGGSHWSASIEPDPCRAGLIFDIACRHAAEAVWLGNRYRQLSDAGIKLIFESDSDAVLVEAVANIRPATAATPKGTTRWKFAIRVKGTECGGPDIT